MDNRALRAVGLAVTTAGIAMGTGACGSSASGTGTATTALPSAASVVAYAATNLAKSHGYSASYVTRFADTGLRSRGSGSYDFSTHQDKQAFITTGANTPARQAGHTVRSVASGKLLYVLYPPAIRSAFPKPWLSFTAAQYNASQGTHGGLEAIKTPFAYGATSLGGSMASNLLSAAKTFTRNGTATINGVKTYRYIGHSGRISIKATTADHKNTHAVFGHAAITAWIDFQGRVRRVIINTTRDSDKTELSSVEMTITSWAVPRITLPPATQTISYPAAKAAAG